MNYFDFYELPISFLLDEGQLRRQFLQLSKKYHPDFYTLESEEKQTEALELSTRNNEAYKTLKDQEKRLKYILELKGLIGEGVKTSVPQSFLMEMMEVNEQVMELQFDYQAEVHQKIEQDLADQEAALYEKIQPIFEAYDDKNASAEDLEQIRDYYLQQRYLKRLKENLQKLQ